MTEATCCRTTIMIAIKITITIEEELPMLDTTMLLMVQMLLVVLLVMGVYLMLYYLYVLGRPVAECEHKAHGADQVSASMAPVMLVLKMKMEMGDWTALDLYMLMPPIVLKSLGSGRIELPTPQTPLPYLIDVMTRPERRRFAFIACQARPLPGRED